MWLAFKALFGFWKERWGWKENARNDSRKKKFIYK